MCRLGLYCRAYRRFMQSCRCQVLQETFGRDNRVNAPLSESELTKRSKTNELRSPWREFANNYVSVAQFCFVSATYGCALTFQCATLHVCSIRWQLDKNKMMIAFRWIWLTLWQKRGRVLCQEFMRNLQAKRSNVQASFMQSVVSSN